MRSAAADRHHAAVERLAQRAHPHPPRILEQPQAIADLFPIPAQRATQLGIARAGQGTRGERLEQRKQFGLGAAGEAGHAQRKRAPRPATRLANAAGALHHPFNFPVRTAPSVVPTGPQETSGRF